MRTSSASSFAPPGEGLCTPVDAVPARLPPKPEGAPSRTPKTAHPITRPCQERAILRVRSRDFTVIFPSHIPVRLMRSFLRNGRSTTQLKRRGTRACCHPGPLPYFPTTRISPTKALPNLTNQNLELHAPVQRTPLRRAVVGDRSRLAVAQRAHLSRIELMP